MSEGTWGISRRNFYVRVGVVAVICFLIGVAASWSPSYTPCPEHQSASGQCDDRASNQENHSVLFIITDWSATHHDLFEAWGVVATAAFTLALFISTLMLWSVTLKTLRHAELSSERQLRAYITVRDVEVVSLNPNDPVLFRIVLENTGQTPATNVRTHASWSPFPEGLPINFTYPDVYGEPPGLPQSRFALGPTQTRGAHGIQIPMNWMHALANGQTRILLWGWVEYDDVFAKQRHRTEYSFWAEVAAGAPGTYAISTRGHDDYNNIDDQCQRGLEPPQQRGDCR